MGCAVDLSKLVRARDLPPYFEPHCHPLLPNSNESFAQIVQIPPFKLELCIVLAISIVHCLSSDDDLALLG